MSCKYCRKDDPEEIRGEEHDNNIYTIKNKTLDMDMVVDIYDNFNNHLIDYKEEQDFIKINYCPMCGEKLK